MLIEHNEYVDVFDCLRDASGRAQMISEVINIIENSAKLRECNEQVLKALRCDLMPNLIWSAKASGKASKVATVEFHRLFLRVDVYRDDIRVIAAALPAECKELIHVLYPIYGKRRKAEGSGIGISLEAALDALDSFNVDDGDLRTATFAYTKECLAAVGTRDARKAAAVELVSYINALGG
jgi:hypothetical protein